MDVYDKDVIRVLKNKSETVRTLVEHWRNKHIINTKGCYYYKDPAGKYVLLTGLLPRLRKTFFPDSDYYNLLKKKPKATKEKISKHRQIALARGKPYTKKKEKPASRGKFEGRIRGTVVHNEIEDFIFLDKKGFLKKHPSIHIYTRHIFDFLFETGWTILRSEFDVYDEKLGIGTSVDIMGVTKEGRLVLFEVKTGYADTWDKFDGYMQGSLHKLTNSPHHQANLQLITSALLIMKGHGIPLEQMLLYVLRVDDTGLSHYKINNEYVAKKGKKIYADLLRNQQESNASKAAKKKAKTAYR